MKKLFVLSVITTALFFTSCDEVTGPEDPLDTPPVLTQYTSVRIYETLNTTAQQPSGLDLSTGNAYGISSTNNVNVDIYYTSTAFDINSAHLAIGSYAGMNRDSYFKTAAASTLTDGADSPVRDDTWVRFVDNDRETNYIFVQDDDSHYSKIKITGFGGGSGPGDPAWLEITWIYNGTANDVRF